MEWSRAKANRILPRKRTGHRSHPLPTTQVTTLHMDITRWSIPKSDWLYSLQSKVEKLYTASKNKVRGSLWLRSWTPYCKVKVKVAQSCLTLYDPMNHRVHEILQTRILEWVAFPFSRGIFLTQGLNPGLSHCRWLLYQLSHKRSPPIAKLRLKLKKVGKTTRPLRYDLNHISYDYTLEVTNRFKVECLKIHG